MDTPTLQKVRDNLLRQRQSLLDWFDSTPPLEKKIHLGPATEHEATAHLQVLEKALAETDTQQIGLCEVCHQYVDTGQLEMDYTAHVCIDHYSAEQKRRLEMDLELSHKMQKALFPQQLPEIAGTQIAAFSQPAQIVGGDYFDFFHFRNGSHGLALADVMGKGMPASMLVASLQASLRILGPENDSPVAIVQRLNELFCHNIHLTKFVTLFLAQYDSTSRTLQYCNAGHNPPLLLRNQASVQWLHSTGAAIGLVEDVTFKAETLSLRPGDILVLYTDGLTEASNADEEEYGADRLASLVQEKSALGAKDLLRELRYSVQLFAGNRTFQDDLTLVVAKLDQ